MAETSCSKNENENLLPAKSTKVYEAAYRKFMDWCVHRSVITYTEDVLLDYFTDLTNKTHLKSSSQWSQYSMIKSVMKIKHHIDISNYSKLRAFLKEQNKGYTPKKAKVLTKEQFDTFLSEAPNLQYLGTKIVLIFGISGSCRCEELVRLTIDNIQDLGSVLLVKLPKAKKVRSFTISGDQYLGLYRKYIALRPQGFRENRLFLKYKYGVCHRQVMGIHKIGAVAKDVAAYLRLPDWEEYTGHCLRQTSVTSSTMLIDGGAITSLDDEDNSLEHKTIEEFIDVKKEVVFDDENLSSPLPNNNSEPSSFKNSDDNEDSVDSNAISVHSASTDATNASFISNKVFVADLNDIANGAFNFQNATLKNCTFHFHITNTNK